MQISELLESSRVSSTSFFSVTVEDFEHGATVRGVDTVLIGGPDQVPIFPPDDINSLTTSESNSKGQRLTNSEGDDFQLPDEARRFCDRCKGQQTWILT